MTVSFSMQPCKTKPHEIDYPHTWTSFVTLLYSRRPLVTGSLAGPCSFQQEINDLNIHACKVTEY